MGCVLKHFDGSDDDGNNDDCINDKRNDLCGKNIDEIDISTNYFTLQTHIHTEVLKSYWPDRLLKIRQNIRILLKKGLVGQAKKFSGLLCRCTYVLQYLHC